MELRVLAQSWLILELGGTQYDVGAATGYRVVPAVLVSLAAGVLIDRLGGRAILLWDRLVLLAPIEVWHVIVLSVASGAVMGLGASSSRTLVSQIVTKVELQAANALSEFGMSVARAIGPLIGGLMITAYGLGAPWVALTGIYLIAVLPLLPVPDVGPPESTGKITVSRTQYIDGLKQSFVRPSWCGFISVRSVVVMPARPVGVSVFEFLDRSDPHTLDADREVETDTRKFVVSIHGHGVSFDRCDSNGQGAVIGFRLESHPDFEVFDSLEVTAGDILDQRVISLTVAILRLDGNVDLVPHFLAKQGGIEPIDDIARALQEDHGVLTLRGFEGLAAVILQGVVHSDDVVLLDCHLLPFFDRSRFAEIQFEQAAEKSIHLLDECGCVHSPVASSVNDFEPRVEAVLNIRPDQLVGLIYGDLEILIAVDDQQGRI